jgi:hypothetical protein
MFYFNRRFYQDDAYITLRYAQNLLQGNGIVWNPGEYVQGYTNFLYLLLEALLGFFGVDLFWASRVLGVSAFCGLVAFLYRYCRSSRVTAQDILCCLPAVIVLTSSPIIVWSIGGLEPVLFSLLVTAGCLLFLAPVEDRYKRILYLVGSGICLSLCTLTRPDGILFVCTSMLWLSLTQRGARLSSMCAFAIPCALLLAPYVLWQYNYYGSVVPNTFYVKVGSLSVRTVVMGITYIKGYALRPPYLPCFLLILIAWVTAARKWNGKLLYLAFSIAGYMAFLSYVGGDPMPAFRMLIPIIPLMSYMFYLCLTQVVRMDNMGLHMAIIVSILLLLTTQLFSPALNPRWEDPASLVGTIVGKYIGKTWPAGSLVALNTAGSTPYYAGQLLYIDMLGLNDPHIAQRRIFKRQTDSHGKGDGLYVLFRKPEYIIVGPAEGTEIETPWFLSDFEMGLSPDFHRNYEMCQVHINLLGEEVGEEGMLFTYYQRKSD